MENKRINLIESVGNLLELKMNELLKNDVGIKLLKNPDRYSQQYFYLKDNKSISIKEKSMSEIFSKFSNNFFDLGLGCVVSQNCIYLGIAHLSTNGLEVVLNQLKMKLS